MVLYWGREYLSQHQFLLLTSNNEIPSWELPLAYLVAAFDFMNISPRWGVWCLSVGEVIATYFFTKKRWGRDGGLLTAAVLSWMPWHIFFSFVIGPCVAGLWTALYLLDPQKWFWRLPVNILGLSGYASYRVVLLWGFLKNLGRRQFSIVGLDLASVVLFALLLLSLGLNQLFLFIQKGHYLTARSYEIVATNYLHALILWWSPGLHSFWPALSKAGAEDIGAYFSHATWFSSPLSWGFSFFFAWGLISFKKDKEHRDLLWLFILSLLCVGFSPAIIHFPFILPAVAFISALGMIKAYQGHKRRGQAGIVISFILALFTNILMYKTDVNASLGQEIFSEKMQRISAQISHHGSPVVWVSTGEEFFSARLAMQKAQQQGFVLGDNIRHNIQLIREKLQETGSHTIFITADQELAAHARTFYPEARAEFREVNLRTARSIELNFSVKSKRPLMHKNVILGYFYELDL